MKHGLADASGTGAGALLLQDENGIYHPMCFFFKKFNRHQCNYSTIEKEALALLLALQKFEVYVGSSHNLLKFLLITTLLYFCKSSVTKTKGLCVGL